MIMEKLNAKQILEIVASNMRIDEFAYGDYKVPEEFDFEGKKELESKFLEARQELTSHPGYGDHLRRDETYKKLLDEYNRCRPFNTIAEKWLESLGLGKIVVVEQYGGEGQGDTWYSVKHFVEHDVYIQTNGWYSSYEGTFFESGYGEEVKPVEKTITVYKPV